MAKQNTIPALCPNADQHKNLAKAFQAEKEAKEKAEAELDKAKIMLGGEKHEGCNYIAVGTCNKCGWVSPQLENFFPGIKASLEEIQRGTNLREQRDQAQAEVGAVQREIKTTKGLYEIAKKQVGELQADIADLIGCPSCHEDHPPSSMCPPFEGRTTGLAAMRPIQWRSRYTKLERKFIQLEADCAEARSLVAKAHTWPNSRVLDQAQKLLASPHPGADLPPWRRPEDTSHD